jgi:dolichol kinase
MLFMDKEIKENEQIPTATRHDLQLGRRFFHMGMGTFVVAVYGFFLEHQYAVYILGAGACLFYIMEQVRLSYPESANFFKIASQYLLRAEEQLQESAALPYAISILLTMITFPKVIAIIAILTLAWADPLSALVGIKFGKKKISKGKTVAGSAAFFVTTLICCLVSLCVFHGAFKPKYLFLSLAVALFVTCFELIPLKLDDNLTIPLFTAVTVWIFGALMGFSFI